MDMDLELEKQIAKQFAELPRKSFVAGEKEKVWLRIQNHIRQNRIALDQQARASKLWPIFRLGKLAGTVLVVALAIGLVGGATKASEGSLPGDALYTVKKAAETVEKAFATTDEAKVKVGIKHAKRRLEEVKILVQEKKDDAVVSETLQALKSTTEQVLTATSASTPEIVNNVVDLVTQEAKVLDSVKDQTQGEVKQAVQEVITASRESVNKLKAEEEVKGTATAEPPQATTTPATAAPTSPHKPKVKDGVIESEIQIHGVMNGYEAPTTPPSAPPEILPEPNKGF